MPELGSCEETSVGRWQFLCCTFVFQFVSNSIYTVICFFFFKQIVLVQYFVVFESQEFRPTGLCYCWQGQPCYQPPPSAHGHMLSCFACSLLVPRTEHTSDTRWEGDSQSRSGQAKS